MVNTTDGSYPQDLAAWVTWDHMWHGWVEGMNATGDRSGDVQLMQQYVAQHHLAEQFYDWFQANPAYVAAAPASKGTGPKSPLPGGAQRHVDPKGGVRLLPTMAAVYQWAQQQGLPKPMHGNSDLWQAIEDGDTEGINLYVPQYGQPAHGAGKLAPKLGAAPTPPQAPSPVETQQHDILRSIAAATFAQLRFPVQAAGVGDDGPTTNGYNPYDDAREGGGSLNARWIRNNPIRSGLEKVGSADTAEHYADARPGFTTGGVTNTAPASGMATNWNVARMPGTYERPDGSVGDYVMDEQTGPGGYYAPLIQPTGAGTTGGGGTTKRI